MLSGSRIYNFDKDRCLCGLEHMRFNGLGSDFRHLGITEDVWNRILCEAQGTILKKRRGKAPENDIALAELAGNAQALPDLSLFTLPLVYVLRKRGLFQN